MPPASRENWEEAWVWKDPGCPPVCRHLRSTLGQRLGTGNNQRSLIPKRVRVPTVLCARLILPSGELVVLCWSIGGVGGVQGQGRGRSVLQRSSPILTLRWNCFFDLLLLFKL